MRLQMALPCGQKNSLFEHENIYDNHRRKLEMITSSTNQGNVGVRFCVEEQSRAVKRRVEGSGQVPRLNSFIDRLATPL